MNGINWNAKSIHKDMVLAMLLHHMSQETRQMLMLECPAAYNDMCGGDYVRVHRVSDGDPIVPGELKVTVVHLDGTRTFDHPWCDACQSHHDPAITICKSGAATRVELLSAYAQGVRAAKAEMAGAMASEGEHCGLPWCDNCQSYHHTSSPCQSDD